jgi:DNA-binding NarL/FixJ family response regulator
MQAPDGGRTAVLLDRQPLWLEAVEHVLAKLGITVVARVTHPDAALHEIGRHEPDIFVLDLGTTNGAIDGVACIRQARAELPNLGVIALAADADPLVIESAFEAGAAAFVTKSAHADELASAARHVFARSIYFQGSHAEAKPRTHPPTEVDQRADMAGLTPRELEILRLAAEGHTNVQLAKILSVTEQTIKFHLSNIYRKLKVSNRTEASHWAMLHQPGSTPRAMDLRLPTQRSSGRQARS